MSDSPTSAMQWIRRLAAAATVLLLVPDIISAAPTCTVSAITPIGFGIYDPLSAAPLDVTSSIEYTCPPGQIVRVEIDAGSSGTFTARAMTNGTDTLRYNLYLDALRLRTWGDGTGGSEPGPGQTIRDGQLWTAYVFARIPPLQEVSVGEYRDTIRITIQF
jgi:spore coat protein U-like protein